jgi:pheromone shutdown protein TraB
MSENSKELADAGSFGLKAVFHAHPAIPSKELVSLMETLLRTVGTKVVEERGMMLGHIKAFVTTERGTLKVNLIDMDIGIETVDRLTSPTVDRGEIKFMAALVGLDDHDVEDIMEDSLEILEDRLELEMAEHEHDHHDHEDHH